jgi:hypothetical protein
VSDEPGAVPPAVGLRRPPVDRRTPIDLDPVDGEVWDLPRDADEYGDPDDPADAYRED